MYLDITAILLFWSHRCVCIPNSVIDLRTQPQSLYIKKRFCLYLTNELILLWLYVCCIIIRWLNWAMSNVKINQKRNVSERKGKQQHSRAQTNTATDWKTRTNDQSDGKTLKIEMNRYSFTARMPTHCSHQRPIAMIIIAQVAHNKCHQIIKVNDEFHFHLKLESIAFKFVKCKSLWMNSYMFEYIVCILIWYCHNTKYSNSSYCMNQDIENFFSIYDPRNLKSMKIGHHFVISFFTIFPWQKLVRNVKMSWISIM